MNTNIVKEFTTNSGHEAFINKVDIDNEAGHYCGYVVCPELANVDYDIVNEFFFENNLDIHGGLTYSRLNDIKKEWTFGFDCAHAYDTIENCDIDFCTNECEKLSSFLCVYIENK